jgi:hypothetical protein
MSDPRTEAETALARMQGLYEALEIVTDAIERQANELDDTLRRAIEALKKDKDAAKLRKACEKARGAIYELGYFTSTARSEMEHAALEANTWDDPDKEEEDKDDE